MAEQEPRFDEHTLSGVLGSPTAVEDTDSGRGWRYRTAGGQVSLEVFPAAGLTRLRSEHVRVHVAGLPTVEREQVVLAHHGPAGDKEIALTADRDTLVFVYAPVSEPPPGQQPSSEVSPPAPPPPVRAEQTAPRQAGPDPAAPAESTRPAAHPDDPQPAGTEQDEATRLQLTGRLGRDPSFRTTKTGTLVGRFPLAVHAEDGHTSWHTVLAFGPRAEQLQRRAQAGEFAQGREVDVVGYLHTNTRPGKDGRPRTVQEVYAVAVKKR